ncbi:MAG TPA: glycosyltransferase family 4 protein [Longimicrobiaceae bacterium]
MRPVLHLIDTDGPGGAETVFVEVAAGLAERGWSAAAAVPGPGWPHDALKARGIEPLVISTGRAWDVGYAARIVAAARRSGAALVHAHLLGPGVYAALAGVFTGIPVVTTLHGTADIAPAEALRGVKLRLLARGRNRIAFVSESLRRAVLARAAIDSARTAVVPNGIDLRAFRPGRDGGLRRELGIAPGAPLVGAVGNLRADKDYSVLLRAAAHLRDAVPGVRVVIAGAGGNEIERELRALSRELGVEETVVFAGFRPDPERVLRTLDVFVLSSRSEGFSLSTAQAMACGVPVVATRCGGPEEIVDDGATGLLVSPAAPDELADAVARLLRDPAARERMGRAGHERAQARYSVERMLDGYDALYRQCLRALEPVAAPGFRVA